MNLNVAVSLLFASIVCGATTDTNSTSPPVQLYKVAAAKDLDCIMFQAGIRLHFNYTVDKKNQTYTYDIPRETNKTAGGTCGNDTQTLHFKFANSIAQLTFTFNKTGKESKNEALKEVTMTFNSTMLPNLESNKTFTAHVGNLAQYECPLGKGFLCTSNMSINFNKSTPLVRLETIELRSEAFREQVNVTSFDSDYTQCGEDNRISNIIPIAVGAALGALVLVVLIAYLVGRKRNQRGYETV